MVATAVEGSEDLVIPGQTGWLVPPRDSMALAEALNEAAHDLARLRSYGESGCSGVEAEYTISAMVEAYERLWAGVLGMDAEL